MARAKITPEEALAFHLEPMPGKLEVVATVVGGQVVHTTGAGTR